MLNTKGSALEESPVPNANRRMFGYTTCTGPFNRYFKTSKLDLSYIGLVSNIIIII
jgi:hypothetical protein